MVIISGVPIFRIFTVHMENFHIPVSSVIRQRFLFQNHPKNLDQSYKMDLDLWDCLGKIKSYHKENFTGLILLFVVIQKEGKLCLIAE